MTRKLLRAANSESAEKLRYLAARYTMRRATSREPAAITDACQARGVFFRGVGTRKCYVLANSTVEQERILQDHSKMRTVRIQPDRREVGAINQDFSCFRDVEGGNQTYDSRLS